MTITAWVLAYLLVGFVLHFMGMHSMIKTQGRVDLLPWWPDLLTTLLWPLTLIAGATVLAIVTFRAQVLAERHQRPK